MPFVMDSNNKMSPQKHGHCCYLWQKLHECSLFCLECTRYFAGEGSVFSEPLGTFSLTFGIPVLIPNGADHDLSRTQTVSGVQHPETCFSMNLLWFDNLGRETNSQ